MIKTIAIASLALVSAGPSVAASQLERAAGADSRSYALREIVQIVLAEKENEVARLRKFYAGSDAAAVSRFASTAYASRSFEARDRDRDN